ncbi:MAG: beta-ketoacyl-acyl-carrier-protein synthase [Clostridiales bacterium]|nr:beta-ketoacyl-acyl-carrier-protein synthase [Clostridiales bacterium]
MKKRVVITGMGAVTSLGMGVEQFWSSIKEGKNGISLVERIDVSAMSTKVAAEIKDFEPSDYIDKKEAKRMDRFTQFAMAASKLAMENSGLDLEKVNGERSA